MYKFKFMLRIAGLTVCFFLLSTQIQASFEESANIKPTGLLDVYIQNRKLGIPNYVTEDLLLTAYGLIRQATLTEQEQDFIYPTFSKFITQLYELHKNTYTQAGKANHDYLAVLNALLKGETEVDHAGNSKRAQQELDLIYQAAGIANSPLWQYAVDYSQFKPRGKYDTSELMQRYFRAYRYASTILFAVQASKSTGVSPNKAQRMAVQAKYLARVINGVSYLQKDYQSIVRYFAWQFGEPKDISVDDMPELSKNYKDGKILTQRMLLYAREHHLQPSVIDSIVNVDALEKGLTVADVRSGFRLFPSRESTSAKIFQQLTYPNVSEYLATCKQCGTPFSATLINGNTVKGFPLVNEIMAMLESSSAHTALETSMDRDYKNYAQAWKKAKAIADKSTQEKNVIMDGMHFDFMRAYLNPQNNAMHNDQVFADDDRRLNSMKGFWTWQQYLAILYTKQSYTLTDKGLSFSDRSGAWLSPTPGLYKNLQVIVKQHIEHTPHPSWIAFNKVLQRCYNIATDIVKVHKISSKDEAFLNNIDKSLLRLTGGVDQPIVIDVHTNPASREVLEQGLEGKKVSYKTTDTKQAVGAVFKHYEFKQPMSNRLTDQEWLEKLKNGMDSGASDEPEMEFGKKLDGQISSLYTTFKNGGVEAFINYTEKHQLELKDKLIPVQITLTNTGGFVFVKTLIEEGNGRIGQRFENMQYAFIPPELIEKIARLKTVWTISISKKTAHPLISDEKSNN